MAYQPFITLDIKGKMSKSGHPRMPYKNKKVERLKNEEKESKMWMIYAYLVRSPPSNRAEPPLQEGGNPFHRSYLIELKKKPSLCKRYNILSRFKRQNIVDFQT